MDALKTMKDEMAMMRVEKTCMEARLLSVETALAENKRVLSEYKAMKKLVDDFLDVVIKAGGNNVDENNSQNLDEETMKGLIDEATRDFTESLNKAQPSRGFPADGRNGGGYDGGTSVIANTNAVKEAGGGNNGGNSGGEAE